MFPVLSDCSVNKCKPFRDNKMITSWNVEFSIIVNTASHAILMYTHYTGLLFKKKKNWHSWIFLKVKFKKQINQMNPSWRHEWCVSNMQFATVSAQLTSTKLSFGPRGARSTADVEELLSNLRQHSMINTWREKKKRSSRPPHFFGHLL